MKGLIYLCTVIALGLIVLSVVIDFDSSIMKWICFVGAGGAFLLGLLGGDGGDGSNDKK